MIKRAVVLAGVGLAVGCATQTASAGGVDVGVFFNVPGPVYAAPPVVYQPPPVVYTPVPQPVYGYGYYPDYGRGRDHHRGWHDRGRHHGWGGPHHGHER